MFGANNIRFAQETLAGCLILLVSLFCPSWAYAQAIPANNADNSIVVLMYHRFGQDQYPSTNVRLEQLDAHIAELASGGYNVLPLPDIIHALRAGTVLPDRTIGITVDDAFRSVFDNAWPKFKAAGLPFTVFVATDNVDQGNPDFMSWDQIKTLHEDGVTIAAHSLSHDHLPALDKDTTAREVNQSIARLEEMLGKRPEFFAYPYGETDLRLMKQVEEAGMLAAFGQQSGAITPAHNIWYLPRFAINERYGEAGRFRQVVNSLGLAVQDVTPFDPHLGQTPGDNPPAMGFTMPSNINRGDELACYHSDTGRIEDMTRLGPYRVELRFSKAFRSGRTRVNCTVPGPNGRWRWFGSLFYVR
ncbi:polysaccharide deacetylase family protein [Aestuariispira insulae]|uniref:Chitooligosaccharide deacetylase n=1 Tax=Aestuariispira insulae TaxID=1461337 RepID=A0A3D9HPT9_9PROT|nr:polysaccharide deacetylase family protein [Aestuariispira insulae]RED51490.1 polysaccharide deacetylase [Aestuariispira insulae]